MLHLHALPMMAWLQAMMLVAGLQAVMLPPIPTTAKKTGLPAEGQRDGRGESGAGTKGAGRTRLSGQRKRPHRREGRFLRPDPLSYSQPSRVYQDPTSAK